MRSAIVFYFVLGIVTMIIADVPVTLDEKVDASNPVQSVLNIKEGNEISSNDLSKRVKMRLGNKKFSSGNEKDKKKMFGRLIYLLKKNGIPCNDKKVVYSKIKYLEIETIRNGKYSKIFKSYGKNSNKNMDKKKFVKVLLGKSSKVYQTKQ